MCEKCMLRARNLCATLFSKRKIHAEFMRYSCCYSCCSSCCYSCCFSCCFSCCYSCSETFFSCAGFWPAVFSCAHGHKLLPVTMATGHDGHRPSPLATACGHGWWPRPHATGQGLWPWPLATATGHGHQPLLVAMAAGLGHRTWPVPMVTGYSHKPCLLYTSPSPRDA